VMGREGLLPRFLARIDARRQTPINAVLVQGGFSIALALVVGAVAGGLGKPIGGSNVYGYLGFLLTLGVLPVYMLTNVAAVRFFARSGELHWFRHVVLPVVGVLLIGGLLVGQIVEQTAAPYTWFPWVIVVWVALVAAVSIWLARRRPQLLAVAGAAMATGEAEEGHVVAHQDA
jgi:amino acid transporter